MRRWLVVVLGLALVGVVPPAHAGYGTEPGAGFRTDSCRLAAGEPVPGSAGLSVVPVDHPSIQAAVNAAIPGQTILVMPGTYRESVSVTTPFLRIRGLDRNTVVLDGESTRLNGIYVYGADGVVIENMTGHNYTANAFYWNNVKGYWGRYLTAYNNGLYGLYAFDARCGQIDHSYTSGNADSGFYIGQCFPCDAVITDIVAERNALGYSGTNAGGNLTLRDSIWRDNALGIVPNSLAGEERPPQRGAIIRDNLIEDNSNATAPGVGLTGQYYGAGIVIAGGNGNIVVGNVVRDHALAGINLSPLPDVGGSNNFVGLPSGNVIWANDVSGSGLADLSQAAASGPGNCWADNTFTSSAPMLIEEIWSCGLPVTPPGGDPRVEVELVSGAAGLNGRAPSDWSTYPVPGPQPNQPDDNGNGTYFDDAGVDTWLPALGLGA